MNYAVTHVSCNKKCSSSRDKNSQGHVQFAIVPLLLSGKLICEFGLLTYEADGSSEPRFVAQQLMFYVNFHFMQSLKCDIVSVRKCYSILRGCELDTKLDTKPHKL